MFRSLSKLLLTTTLLAAACGVVQGKIGGLGGGSVGAPAPSPVAAAAPSPKAAAPVRSAPAPAPAPAVAAAPSAAAPAAEPSLDVSMLPAKLVELVDALNPGEGNEPSRLKYRKELVASAGEFDAAWKKYLARKVEVDAALARSQALVAGGDLAGARTLLEGMLAPPVRDERGDIERNRGLLEPIDAELPAVQALIEVAAKQGDYLRVVEAAGDLYLRRSVQANREAELLIWLAHHRKDRIERLWPMFPDDRKYVRPFLQGAFDAENGGYLLAEAHLHGLDKYGMKSDSEGGRKGDPILFDFRHLDEAQLTARTVTWSHKEEWDEPYGCVETRTVDSIDPKTGRIRYRLKCKHRTIKRETSVHVGLAHDLPTWATSDPSQVQKIAFVGTLDAAAPNTKLSAAKVADLRFFDRLRLPPFGL